MADEDRGLIKVLVVDDSAFMRKVIADILNSDEKIKVIGSARNGKEAISLAIDLKPDAITLDIEMPEMNGLECLENLKKMSDIPVLMLSSLTYAGAEATIKALESGAIDFITKPTNIFNMTSDEKKAELINKVKFVADLRHKGKAKKAETPVFEEKKRPERIETERKPTVASNLKNIVAIGVSTGGPKALREVIPLLPPNIPAAVLVVQHMLPGFTKPLADRLNSLSEIEVKEAENEEVIRAGCVYIAPGDYHMGIGLDKNNAVRIKLSDEPPIGGHRPAVDRMMESIAKTRLQNVIAVIMTGMGGDGSKGILEVKHYNNGYIIAQDEKSCIVFGMPKVAIETGTVDAVVALNEIANEILRKLEV